MIVQARFDLSGRELFTTLGDLLEGCRLVVLTKPHEPLPDGWPESTVTINDGDRYVIDDFTLGRGSVEIRISPIQETRLAQHGSAFWRDAPPVLDDVPEPSEVASGAEVAVEDKREVDVRTYKLWGVNGREVYSRRDADLMPASGVTIKGDCRMDVDAFGRAVMQPKPEPTEGDRLAEFFKRSAHDGHEAVRYRPPAPDTIADLSSAHDDPSNADGWMHAFRAHDDRCDTIRAINRQRLERDRLAATLAQIPDDFDLLPDADR